MAYELVFLGIIGILVIVIIVLMKSLSRAQKAFDSLKFEKQSQSVRYGKTTEQFMPFMKTYPYDPENFRFLGKPIDGVQFEKDKIIFVEFKTGKSRLSAKQKTIKELVKEKNVDFEEISIS